MKFTENCIEIDTSDPSKIVKAALVLTFTAPYRLVTEISSKVVFLGKDKIQKILLYAVIIAGAVLVAMLIGRNTLGEESLFTGRFPPVLIGAGLVILIGIYAVFSSRHFVVYDQFDQLFTKALGSGSTVCEEELPEEKEEAPVREEASVEEFLAAEFGEANGQAEENKAAAKIPESSPIAKVEEEYYREMDSLVPTLQNKNFNGFMTPDKVQELSDAMEASTDPSKYLSEEFIAKFMDEIESSVLKDVEELDLGVIPTGFTCTD